ncbi:hypothetical protein BH11ACT3_BH11ACT3_14350 [soil metagenome]
MARRWPWLLAAFVLVALTIAGLWLNRPTWGYCIEEGPNRGCDVGVFSLAATVGTIGLAILLVVYVGFVAAATGQRVSPVRIIGLAVLVIASIASFALLVTPIEAVPMP